jgi:hypothetical protein
MKRILTATLFTIASTAFAQVSNDDKVFIGETDSNEVVYIIAPSVEIKKTQRGNYFITGDAEVVGRTTGKSDFWNIAAPLMTCAIGRGPTVIMSLTAVANGVPAEKATEQFHWEKNGTKTADAIINVLCLTAEKMIDGASERPKKKRGAYL